MKYLSVLIVFSVLMFTGTANAQSTSKLNGKSFTYVMKNIDGTGDEIIDKMTFTGSSLSSERFTSSGYKSSNVVEKNATANSAQFEVTLSSASDGTMKFNGLVTDSKIDGTVLVTDTKGNQTTMAIRGMLTEEWDNIQKAKQEHREKQK